MRKVNTKKQYNYGKPISKRNTNIGKNPKTNQNVIDFLKSKWLRHKFFVLVIILCAIFLLVLAWMYKKQDSYDQAGNIERPYEKVLKGIEEEPEDITQQKYKPKIPEVIQKDIDKMLASKEDIKIIYYTKDRQNKMIISKESEDDNKIQIDFESSIEYLSSVYEDITENIAFYQNGDKLVVYGGSQYLRRDVYRYTLSDDGLDMDFQRGNIDLYGTNLEYDNMRISNKDVTLIEKNQKYMFYRLGEQIGKTFEFPGEGIQEWNYYYILDNNNDMYYMYYSTDSNNPWIHFSRVAQSVDRICEIDKESVVLKDDAKSSKIKIPIYEKDGKKYSGIPDKNLEKSYGQNYGLNCGEETTELDFSIETVEISSKTASRIKVITEESFINDMTSWYLEYEFQKGGRKACLTRRIDGIDSELYSKIPESELKKFDGKVVSADEIEEVIAKLKALYQEYEDNKF